MKAAKHFVKVDLGAAVHLDSRQTKAMARLLLRKYDVKQAYGGCLKEWTDCQQGKGLPLWTEKADQHLSLAPSNL
jgi:hypothetical protein